MISPKVCSSSSNTSFPASQLSDITFRQSGNALGPGRVSWGKSDEEVQNHGWDESFL